jgi:hypothetical protein
MQLIINEFLSDEDWNGEQQDERTGVELQDDSTDEFYENCGAQWT